MPNPTPVPLHPMELHTGDVIVVNHTGHSVHWNVTSEPVVSGRCVSVDIHDPQYDGQAVMDQGATVQVVRTTSDAEHEVLVAGRMLRTINDLAARLDTLRYPLEGPQIAALIRDYMDTARMEASR
jgi:hypothetical protein